MKRVLLDISAEHITYFDTCARIRDISRTRLLERLLEMIAQDELVLSVLDDDSKPWPREKHKHGYRQC